MFPDCPNQRLALLKNELANTCKLKNPKEKTGHTMTDVSLDYADTKKGTKSNPYTKTEIEQLKKLLLYRIKSDR